jgi:Regulator of chromosome condensation (RCC1) repeat
MIMKHVLRLGGAAMLVLVFSASTGLAPAANAAVQASALQPVWHWGSFSGDGNAADAGRALSPVSVAFPDDAPVVQVASSNSTQYALLADGSLWAWGQGTTGQLGNGGDQNSLTTPVQVQFPRGVRIAFIPANSMPFNTAFAVDTNGNVWGWGDNLNGELCLGNKQAYRLPVQLPLTGVTALAGASGHAVYDSGGVVYSCGGNTGGVLGAGSHKSGSTVPVQVSGLNGQHVKALVASFDNAGALLSNGLYYDWGFDTEGQLGDGAIGASSPVPVLVRFPDRSPVTQVAEGGSEPDNGQTLVMLSDGSLYAWGSDSYSQLGDGGTRTEASPVRFSPPSQVTYSALASGGTTSYAISTSRTVYAWGQGKNGEVGDGSTATARVPVAVLPGVSAISATAMDVVAS